MPDADVPVAEPLPVPADLASARTDLLARLDDLGRSPDAPHVRHTARRHPEPGPDGGEVVADVVWIGPDDATDVLLLVSGTHGVEGLAGSALQRTWLRDLAAGSGPALPSGPDGRTAVCLVHALNPWGMAWVRRVDHENVDLNRNSVDHEHPPANPGYDELAATLVPETWDDATQQATTEALLEVGARVGFDELQRRITGGQWAHPTGVFYGGAHKAWSLSLLDELCGGPLRGRERVVVVDLHTGLGPWGVGECISSDPAGSEALGRARATFGDDVTCLAEGGSVSAELTGEWLPVVSEVLTGAGAEVTAVALEYGTVDGVTVLQALRADAWLHAHGDPTGPEAAPIKAALRAAFADDDPAWIAACHDRFVDVVGRALGALAG